MNRPSSWLAYLVLATAISESTVLGQPPKSSPAPPPKVGGTPPGEVLKRLGAKLESGTGSVELNNYSSHFDRVDLDRDGKHTRQEFVDKGSYMTPQARAGIFQAADEDADGVVTKDEYILNRIITDEAKSIVQAMDDNQNRVVDRAEFVQHATKSLADAKLARQVFAALDADGDGRITIPEYLRIWGQWARGGHKPASERMAARRAKLAGEQRAESARPKDAAARKGPPNGGSPPSVDQIFARFDQNKDGKLQQNEIPEFAQRFILPADANGDHVVTKEELSKARGKRRTGTQPGKSKS